MIEKETIFEKADDRDVKITTFETKKEIFIKWNIYINQKAIIDNGMNINIIDAAIFDFIYNFISSGNALSIVYQDRQYYWMAYQRIIDSMPLLEIKNKNVLARHIQKLIDSDLLSKIVVPEMGNKTFFCIGDNAKKMFFDMVSTQKMEGIYSKVERVSTQKSNNTDINDTNINTYGELHNVLLSSNEYNNLIKDYGKQITNTYIEKLSLYIPNKKPPAYKDHNAVIRQWLNKDNIKKAIPKKPENTVYKETTAEPLPGWCE